jgi:HK97 family phage portal protein
MGFLERFLGVEANESRPNDFDDRWYSGFGSMSSAGVAVNAESALRIAAVYAAVRILSETLAMLPLVINEQRPDGTRRRAPENPLFRVLHDRPNADQTSFGFREQMQSSLALRGNAYAHIVSTAAGGAVTELRPIHPDAVYQVQRLQNREVVYDIRLENGQARRFSSEEIFHIKGMTGGAGMSGTSNAGLVGLSPIGVARNVLGLASASEDYAARLYSNDARPGGMITHPGKLSIPAARAIKEGWESMHQGASNAHKVAVLEEGMKWEQMGMSAEDSQFIESRKFSVTEIARIFRIPPHMLADLEHATFTNIEHQGIEFVTYTMLPWLVRWEQQINKDLISPAQAHRLSASFIVDGLLRGTTTDRYAAHNLALNGGWKTRNEVREIEGLNRLEGLDEILAPLNMGNPGGRAPANAALDVPAVVPGSTDDRAQLAAVVWDAASSLAHKESTALARISGRVRNQASGDREVFAAEISAFYESFAEDVSKRLGVPLAVVEEFTSNARDRVIQFGASVASGWENEHVGELVAIAIGSPRHAAQLAGAYESDRTREEVTL